MSAEVRLGELGLVLPPPAVPIASYVTFVRTGDLAYTYGHGPQRADATWVTGRVGEDLDLVEARAAARLTGLGLLATLREHLGSLDEVVRVVRVSGMVNCTSDFADHMDVIDACSDLFVDVFGETGRHVRSVVGVASIPLNLPVEIEMIVEVRRR
jgi:enamine deaminase RidA (YjgF/YER057c/UK114 family)